MRLRLLFFCRRKGQTMSDDPFILAFRLSIPLTKNQFGMQIPLLAIWHRDPRKEGHPDPGRHGDTAGWTFARLNAAEVAYAEFLAGKDNDFDNLKHWFPGQDYETRLGRIKQIFRLHKTHSRPWWHHPRWQFWNWRINPKW